MALAALTRPRTSPSTLPRNPASRPGTRALRALLSALVLLAVPASEARSETLARVAITEIHYHPESPNGDFLEFIELKNVSGGSLSLGGWRLSRGIEYTFPAGVELQAGAYVVVCRNREAFLEAFPVDASRVFGDYEGSLDNGGEKLVLRDEFGAPTESVVYDDGIPWRREADGDGASLQRLCEDASPSRFQDWTAAIPSPLGPAAAAGCPAPEPPTSDVLITEIQYHPPTELRGRAPGKEVEDLEFIELHNRGNSTVSLGGWSLVEGIRYTFAAGTDLEPGAFLILARNPFRLGLRFPDLNRPGLQILGGFEGSLSNSGERLTLIDGGGRLVDTVQYRDGGEWPYAADGEGRSLERIHLGGSGDDPASWQATRPDSGSWTTHVVQGLAGPRVSTRVSGSVRFTISLEGVGEVLVDSIELIDLEDPGRGNIITNGDFEEELDGWALLGNASSSEWDESGGVDGTGALHLKTDEPCPLDGCWAFEGVTRVVPEIKRLGSYQLSVRLRHVRGSSELSVGFLDGLRVKMVSHSAGESSRDLVEVPPPHVEAVGRFPRQATPDDPVWITARVRGASEVLATVNIGDEAVEVPLLDDGLHLDGVAGDGIYGAELSPLEDQTRVTYRIVASGNGGARSAFPVPRELDAPLPWEHRGFLVEAPRPGAPLPEYHLLLPGEVDGSSFQSVNAALNCSELRPADFVHRGELYPHIGLRFRGNTACWIDKRNFKLAFQKNRRFRGLKKMNLNGIWTDKALIRESLAWDFIRELGLPAMQTEYSRLLINGDYYGLFLCLEHPDENFLRRTGLDPDGTLYKARQPSNINDDDLAGVNLFGPGFYNLGWEEEVHSGSDFSDIDRFIDELHRDGNPRHGGGDPSTEFFEQHVDEDSVIEFQISQVVLNNIDSAVKNHFLHHDLDTGIWTFLPWDQDLVFGKFFTRDAVDPGQGRQVGTLNDIMLSDQGWDLHPWIMTSVLGNQRFNWLLDLLLRAGDGHYQRAYLVRLVSVLEEKYRNDVYDPRIDRLVESLREEIEADYDLWGRYPSNVPAYPQELDPNVAIVKEQLALHRDFLLRYLDEFHPDIADFDRLKITEILVDPEGGDQDLEFVELTNFTDRAIELEGWTISGIDFEFPPGASVPAGEQLVVARSPSAFRERYPVDASRVFGPYEGALSSAGESLRLRDAGPGYPATIDLVRILGDADWPSIRRGHSLELVSPSRDRDNDPGTSWRLSREPGGTPLVPPTLFLRGDVTLDAIVDMTDAIGILSFVFLGQALPNPCQDSADVDDSGSLDITDPIFLLSHLFLGTEPPAAPFPGAGTDPTDDDTLPCPPPVSTEI